MSLIPLSIAHIGIHSHDGIDDRNIAFIFIRAIPAVLLKALLALRDPRDTKLSRCPVDGGTAQTLYPIRLQGRVALGHYVPGIDQDLVHLYVTERTRIPRVVRVRAVG